MDFGKLTQMGKDALSGQSGSNTSNTQGQNVGSNTDSSLGSNTQSTTGQNTGNEDYGDKGLDFLEKKTGHTMGRDTNEKITDGARGLYEKATGSKLDPKYSN